MVINIFQIPHIQDSITENLTFKDLLSCVLVCKSWKQELIPVLWKEVHTYCDEVSESYSYYKYNNRFPYIPHLEYRYHSYFTTVESRNALLRNCAYIRTLVVRNNNIVRFLHGTPCTNLLELHYTVDTTVSGDQGMDTLMDLMEQNPYLRALALRNVVLLGKEHKSEFKGLMELLCHNSPVVSSVDIKFIRTVSLPMVAYILSELLTTKQNVTLSLTLDTAMRHPAKQQQEDQEVQEIMDSITKETLQVRNLDINVNGFDHRSHLPVLSKILSKCKGLESIKLNYCGTYLSQWFSTVARESCSNLQHLELYACHITNEDWASIVKSCRRLVSFISNAGLHLPLVEALHGHRTSLEHIINRLNAGSSLGDISLLGSCSKLKTFSCSNVPIMSPAIMGTPEWICHGLQKLDIKVCLVSYPFPVTEEEFTSWVKTGSQARRRLCENIGRLHSLRELRIVHNCRSYRPGQSYRNKNCSISKRLNNYDMSSMGLGHGLEALVDLKNLVNFSMSMINLFSRKDVEWMVEHWPRLESLTQITMRPNYRPITTSVSGEAGKPTPFEVDYSGNFEWMRELRRKRPSLEFETWVGDRRIGPYEDLCEGNGSVLYSEPCIDHYQELMEEEWVNRVEMYEDQLARYI